MNQRRRSSAASIVSLEGKDYGIDSSRQGYYFRSSIWDTQRKIHRSTRPSSHYTRPPSKATPKTPSLRTTINIKVKPPKDNAQASVKNELRVRHNHYILRTLKKELKNAGPVNRTLSDGVNTRFDDLSNTLLYSKYEKKQAQEMLPTKARVLSFEVAQKRVVQGNCKGWLRKRLGQRNEDSEIMNFASALFDSLDSEKTAELSGETVLRSFLSLGATTDSAFLEKTLLLICKKKSLSRARIDLKTFKGLFKSDFTAERILKSLNENELKGRKGSTVSMSEHQALIESWWKLIGNHRENFDQVALLLSKLKIVRNYDEGTHFLYLIAGHRREISQEMFREIFAKSVLQGALIHLAKRLFASSNVSSSLRVSAYKRALILSGVGCPYSDISAEEGERTLNTLGMYNHIVRENP